MSEQVQEQRDQDTIPDPVLTPVGLPDITSSTGALDTNAQVVWSMVRYTELDTPLRPSVHEGEAGYLWSGRMSKLLSDLWPIMRNPGERTRETRIRLGHYLKLTHNMVCLDKGFGAVRKNGETRRQGPLWWVRADWNDRREFFQVTSSWPESDADDQNANDDTAYAPETVDPTAPDEAVKVYTCDYPGCDEGVEGSPFVSTHANVMPMHRKAHDVTNTIIATMARLMEEPGADAARITLTDVARAAGVHQTSVSQRFTRDGLQIRAMELLREQAGGPGVDAEIQAGRREKLLRLAAFGAYNGTPLMLSLLDRVLVGVPRSDREALLRHLVETGELRRGETTDSMNRVVEVYDAADPAVLARALNVSVQDLGAAAPSPRPEPEPAPVVADPVTDYIAVLRDFLIIAEGRETAIREREAVIEDQAAKISGQDSKIAEQRSLIDDARTELRTLRELIAPLANIARDAES